MLRRSLCVTALALALAPSAHAADWTDPVTLTADGTNQALALAPGGNLVASYDRYVPALPRGSSVPIPRLSARTGRGSFTHLDGPESDWPWLVEGSADGRLHAFALVEGRIERRMRPPGGAFGGPAALTPAGERVDSFWASVSAGGALGLGWQSNQGLRMKVLLPSAAPLVGVADDGQAAAAISGAGAFTHRVRAAGSAGAWTAPLAVNGDFEQLAVNRFGDALLTWTEGQVAKAAYRPRDGVFGASVELGTVVGFASPVPAIGPDGSAIAFVPRTASGGGTELAAVRLGPGGAGAVDVLTTGEVDRPFGIIDEQNRAWAVWKQAGSVYATRQDLDTGSFAEPRRLSAAGEDVNSFRFRIAASGDGAAAVTWNTNADPSPVRLVEYTDPPPSGEQPPAGGDGGASVPGPPPAPGPAPAPAPAPSTPRGTGGIVPQTLTKVAVRRTGRRATVTFTLRAAGNVTLVVERRSGKTWRATSRRASVAGKRGANRATLSLKGLKPGRYRVVVRAGAARVEKGLTVPR
jgi:hypothetical protein